MSYFTAVIAGDSSGWRARDVDVEDAASLDDLADALRVASRGDGPVLAVIEHEDDWFALVRVDGEDDEPQVFVSDLPAASRGVYADLLSSAGDQPVVVDDTEPVVAAPAADPPDDDEEVDVADLSDLGGDDDDPASPSWAGNADLLADLGVDSGTVLELCDEYSHDPAAVLAEIGERAGFAELLEALR